MATIQQVVKLTYEDYLSTPADTRYELLDGDLILVPAPNLKHQKVQRRLGQRLSQFIEEHDLGEFFYAPCDDWLVDPIAETVAIHRQRGGVLAAAHTFGRGQTLRSPLFAGLELRMNDVPRPDAEPLRDPRGTATR